MRTASVARRASSVRRADARLLAVLLVGQALASVGCGGGGPAAPPKPPTVAIVDAHRLSVGATTCAIDDQRHVACWGESLGSRKHEPSAPARIRRFDGSVELTGGGGLCARFANGRVRCSGEAREWHQLPGSDEVPGLRGATSIAFSEGALCAVIRERVVCSLGYRHAPEPVGIDRALTLEGAGNAICARRRDAPIMCLVTAHSSAVRFTVAGSEGAEISFDSEGFPCALRNGLLSCIRAWPSVADPDQYPRPRLLEGVPREVALGSPEQVPGVVRAMAADATSCRLSTDATLRCTPSGRDGLDPLSATLSGVTSFALSGRHVCAHRRDATVLCWGANHLGQSGVMPSALETPTRVRGLPPVTAVATGGVATCALDASGATWCWADVPGWTSPIRVSGMPPLARLAVSHPRAVCGAARSDGSVRCLCYGEDRALRVRQVEGLDGSRELVGGLTELIARGADGTVRMAEACPYESERVPDPDAEPEPDPGPRWREIRGLRDAAVWTAGAAYACAVTPDGALRCGYDNYAAQWRPTATVLRGVTRAWAGIGHACAEVGGRGLVCFELARSSDARASAPLRAIDAPILGMEMGVSVVCIVLADGSVRCGPLAAVLPPCADGSCEDSLREIPGVTGAQSVTVGDSVSPDPTSCALTRDGSVWCWGREPRGDGHPTYVEAPTRVALP